MSTTARDATARDTTARDTAARDTAALAQKISTQLKHTGVDHQVIAAPDGIVVRGLYGDAITVCGAGDTYRLLAGDGRAVDTRVRIDDPAELLGLFLVFHALWSINRVVRADGATETLAAHPSLALHTALLVGHLGLLAASREARVASYARGILADVRQMLAA